MSATGQHQVFLTYGPKAAAAGGGGGGQVSAAALSGSEASSFQVVLPGVTAGQSIALAVGWGNTSGGNPTITTVTCTGESNLTVAGSPLQDAGSGQNFLQTAYLANVTSSGDKTITVNFSSNFEPFWGCFLSATAFSGADTGDFFEAIGTGVGPNNISGQTVAAATATATEGNSILFLAAAATFFGNEGTPLAGGLTQIHDTFDENPGDPGGGNGFVWTGINTASAGTGSKTGSITMTDEDNWMAILLIFNPA